MIIRIPASKISKHTQYARAHAHTHIQYVYNLIQEEVFLRTIQNPGKYYVV